jgi:hypothetical protein
MNNPASNATVELVSGEAGCSASPAFQESEMTDGIDTRTPCFRDYEYLAGRLVTVFVFRLRTDKLPEFVAMVHCRENEYWADAYRRERGELPATNAWAFEV